MSDRVDYYFHQKLTEAELDLGFELLEKADRNLAADIGVYGIVSGAEPTPHSPVADLTIDLTAPGRAYDHIGQRIFFGTGQRVDCAIDHSGIPTEVTVAGKERWLGVFLKFDRLLSDPRTDGNSQQVYFRRDETFELVVRQGPEGNVGTAPKVPLQEDELLVCDGTGRPRSSPVTSTAPAARRSSSPRAMPCRSSRASGPCSPRRPRPCSRHSTRQTPSLPGTSAARRTSIPPDT